MRRRIVEQFPPAAVPANNVHGQPHVQRSATTCRFRAALDLKITRQQMYTDEAKSLTDHRPARATRDSYKVYCKFSHSDVHLPKHKSGIVPAITPKGFGCKFRTTLHHWVARERAYWPPQGARLEASSENSVIKGVSIYLK